VTPHKVNGASASGRAGWKRVWGPLAASSSIASKDRRERYEKREIRQFWCCSELYGFKLGKRRLAKFQNIVKIIIRLAAPGVPHRGETGWFGIKKGGRAF